MTPIDPANPSPYPGLRPFHPNESIIFFGREKQVDQLLDRLASHRFLAVVGMSGCGKSSLVTAGLVPALQSGLMLRAGVRWRVAALRPGGRPLRNLAEALALCDDACPGTPEEIAFLEATLRRGPLGLIEAVRDMALPAGTCLLVLVDQFEEIFRFRHETDRDEANAFVGLLLGAVSRAGNSDPYVEIYVVLTMRSDFLGDCARFHGLPEALNDSQFLIPRLSRDERQEAIEGPAKVFGGAVERALVGRLLNDMGDAPDELPLMQHVLARIWHRCKPAPFVDDRIDNFVLTLDDYEAAGGLDHALSLHADEVYQSLTASGQAIAQTLFRCLTGSFSKGGEGRRDFRRPASLETISLVAGVAPSEVAEVADAFRAPNSSFLMPPPSIRLIPETYLDISHESLIRRWERLHHWVNEEARSAETYLRLVDSARRWHEGRADLLGLSELADLSRWRDIAHPNPHWAARYGSDYHLAIEFLNVSEQAARAASRRPGSLKSFFYPLFARLFGGGR